MTAICKAQPIKRRVTTIPRQTSLLAAQPISPFKTGLLKWIGNKQRFAHTIASFFPAQFNTYREPFVGSGAVLATIAPTHAIASDSFKPLMEIWQTLATNPVSMPLMLWRCGAFPTS